MKKEFNYRNETVKNLVSAGQKVLSKYTLRKTQVGRAFKLEAWSPEELDLTNLDALVNSVAVRDLLPFSQNGLVFSNKYESVKVAVFKGQAYVEEDYTVNRPKSGHTVVLLGNSRNQNTYTKTFGDLV